VTPARRFLVPAAVICLLLSSAPVTAQASDPSVADAGSTDPPYWRTNLFGRFFQDQRYLVGTWWPNEIRQGSFTGPMLAGLAFAVHSGSSPEGGMDGEFAEYVRGASWGHGSRTWRRVSNLGNASTGALLIGTGYLVGRCSNNDRLAEASSLSAEALLSAGLYSTVLKALTARTRPAGGGRGDFFEYRPAAGKVNGSFPSGHATGAFTVATVFAEIYADHRWAPWVAYGTAGLIGASRVSLGRHFPSDILVGAVLGHSIGRMAVARQRGTGEPVTRLEPFVDPVREEAGVVWTRRW